MNSVSAQVTPDSYPDKAELEGVVAAILAEARAQGASGAEAGVSFEAGLSVTVRLGEVETLEYHRDRGLGVTVYFGQRKGSASTSDLGREAINATVRAACGIARYTAEDDCAGLADAALMATDIPDLDLCHPWDIAAEQAIELATRCEDAARAADPRISNSEGGSVSTHLGLRVYGNSHGFNGGYYSTRHSLSCAVIGVQDEAMQRDYWYTVARDARDMDDAVAVGRRAAERTVRRLGARRLSTRIKFVLVTPNFHKTHHSINIKEGNANFGILFVFWDYLFKTVCHKSNSELKFLTTGIDNQQSPEKFNVSSMFLNPFK